MYCLVSSDEINNCVCKSDIEEKFMVIFVVSDICIEWKCIKC